MHIPKLFMQNVATIPLINNKYDYIYIFFFMLTVK